MNNKFGPGRDYREAHEPFWRGTDEDRVLRSPDQEFETSGNYREPPYDYAKRGGFAGRGPKGYTRTDDRIREDICERLSWNDEVDATEIDVKVENGEVSLEGSVETRHMKRVAEDLVERVPGVVDVNNRVRVRRLDRSEPEGARADELAPAGSHRASAGSATAR